MFFQMLGGYVGDRIPKNIALFMFTAVQGAAIVLLATATTLFDFYLFAVLFGIGFGGRNPLTTAIRGEYFGRRSFGKILGISTVPMNILLLISSPMAGYMRDRSDSYESAFMTLAVLNFVGAGLFLMSRKPKLPTPGNQPGNQAGNQAGSNSPSGRQAQAA
jgi:MFS family permease